MMDIATLPKLATLQADWTFSPSRAPWRVQLARAHARLRSRRIAAPAYAVVRPPVGVGDWTIYFIWSPAGQIDPAHRFAIDRLRALGRPLMIVCATPSVTDIPDEIVAAADALIWKDLPGFDFSAYAHGLRVLATHCPGSNALVLNDSTFGPLTDLRPWLARMRWDLTGFTASSNVENHLQSYAFHMRDVTPARMAALAPVLPARYAHDHFWSVVLWQETRFARVASRTMSVGSLLYADNPAVEDPMLQLALPLVDGGFPFLKRSLLGKLEHVAPREATLAALERAGYPLR